MPVYVYRRQDGSSFELQQRMADETWSAARRPDSASRVSCGRSTPRYEGTGFYSTDHRKTKAAKQPKAAGGE